MPMKRYKPEQIVNSLRQWRETQRYEGLGCADEDRLTQAIIALVVSMGATGIAGSR